MGDGLLPGMAVGARWKRTSEMALNGRVQGTDSPAKYKICTYSLEFFVPLR